jgi:Zn-dependent protease with chaperone function
LTGWPLDSIGAGHQAEGMSDSTSLEASKFVRVKLTQIAPVAWEHATDRAALNALRAIPTFDDIVRRVVGFLGERGVRLLFQANAVRVGPTQFPRLHRLMAEVCETLDWSPVPEVYVSQTPFANAGAYGMERPFIVLQSGVVSLLDESELRVVLGHELGHVMSEHSLYRTVLAILLAVGSRQLPFLAGAAFLPLQMALMEWSRKSELSCDRAGLLASQDPVASMSTFMKMAGGGAGDEMDVNAFMAQAREYEDSSSLGDTVTKILNTLGRSHPFGTLRAASLEKWIQGSHYDRIVRGEYPRRGTAEAQPPIREGFGEAASHYTEQAREAASTVAGAARKARDAVAGAFSKKKTE